MSPDLPRIQRLKVHDTMIQTQYHKYIYIILYKRGRRKTKTHARTEQGKTWFCSRKLEFFRHPGNSQVSEVEGNIYIYMYIYIYIHIYIYIPALGQGRGGAWDHRRCGTWFVTAMAFTMSKLVPASSPPAGPSKATLPQDTSGQNTMLPQAFPKPTSPPASPSKATLPLNIAGQTLGPSAFKALQACRLHAHGHGLHHVQACSSQLAPPQAHPKTLPLHTRGQTPGPCAFKGVQACRLPALKPFKCFRRPFQSQSRPPQAHPRQLFR